MVAVAKVAYEEILNEIQRTPKPSHYRYELVIYVQGTNERVPAQQITDIDTIRNFEVSYADQIMINAAFLHKYFISTIYPNRTLLMAELKRLPITESSEALDHNRSIVVRNYRAMLVDSREDSLRTRAGMDDNLGLKQLKFQLFDPVIEQLRLQTFGATFEEQTPINCIRWLLMWASSRIKTSTEHSIKGVECWEPNVDEVNDVVIIPHGTPLLDVPGYIQKHWGGVYNYGIGYYLHSPMTPYGDNVIRGRVWYVYPLYDPTRYEKSKYRLDVIVLPQSFVTSQDRSWYLKDSTIYVATTGSLNHVDEKDFEFVNKGNGVRFAKATDSFNGWAATSKNVAKADPAKNTAQFFAKSRDNKMEAAPFGPRRFTDNVAYELSELTMREVQMVKLVWNNCSSELLIPGMPLRIQYVNKKGKEELYGTLLCIEEHVGADMPGMTSQRMRTNCALTIAVLPREV